MLINTYHSPVKLFVIGGGEIKSTEGITQGDPMAMAMYALVIAPLIKRLRAVEPDVKQTWFADDATAAGNYFPYNNGGTDRIPPKCHETRTFR